MQIDLSKLPEISLKKLRELTKASQADTRHADAEASSLRSYLSQKRVSLAAETMLILLQIRCEIEANERQSGVEVMTLKPETDFRGKNVPSGINTAAPDDDLVGEAYLVYLALLDMGAAPEVTFLTADDPKNQEKTARWVMRIHW